MGEFLATLKELSWRIVPSAGDAELPVTQGSVVYGCEPEFEECTVVASSLTEFLDVFVAALQSPAPTYPFGLAVPQNAA